MTARMIRKEMFELLEKLKSGAISPKEARKRAKAANAKLRKQRSERSGQ